MCLHVHEIPKPPVMTQKEIRRALYQRKLAARKAAKLGKKTYTRSVSAPRDAKSWHESFVYTCKHQLPSISEDQYDPHFGLETIASSTFALETLSKFAGINLPDYIIREVEGVMLLMVNLSQQSTALGVITSVLTWAQGRCSKSLFQTLTGYIHEMLSTEQSSGTPDWLTCLRDVKQNWELCKNNRAFKQVSKLLGCLVMIGLCDVSDLTFNVGNFKVMAPDVCERHTSALDIADALFETIVFFTEGAYMCYQTRSLRPMLINDRTAMELDAEYAQVMAWYELVKNGNLKKFADISDQEFEERLNNLSSNLRNLSQSLKGLDKKLVLDKFQKILIVQNDYVTKKIASGVRHSPWAIELFGESSQGKTTLGDQLIDAVLTSQNLPTDKRFRCAHNPGDKFMSNWTSDKLVMIFDDVANDKSNFVERPPTRAIIDVCNNQMYYAPKAELDAKGRCFVEPWIAMATTNKKDLDAATYSNCPYSIQRRMTCITVRAKPEFQRIEDGVTCGIDSAKVREHYTVDGVYTPPMYDDIWEIDIEVAVKPEMLHQVAEYKPITYRGKVMQNITMGECIQWGIDSFAIHKKNQEAMLEGMRKRTEKMQKCVEEGCIHLRGNCPDHPDPICPLAQDPCLPDGMTAEELAEEERNDPHYQEILRQRAEEHRDELERVRNKTRAIRNNGYDPHFGFETVGACRKLWGAVCKTKDTVIDGLYDRVDHDVSNLIYEKGTKFLKSIDWVKIVPTEIMENNHTWNIFRYIYKDKLISDYTYESRRLKLTFLFSITMLYFAVPWKLFLVLAGLAFVRYMCAMRCLYDKVENELFDELKTKNMEISPMLKRYRDDYAKVICGVSVGIAALYAISRAYRAYRANQQAIQGSLEPKTPQEIEERDKEQNVWTTVSTRELPIGQVSKTTGPQQLLNNVEKALLYGTIADPVRGNGMMNCMMISSNVMLVPDHYFTEYGDQLNVTFRKSNPESSGGKFVGVLHKDFSHLIEDTDIRVCYVANGGTYKNLVNHFPTGDMPKSPFQLRWRARDGSFVRAKGLTEPRVVETVKQFKGGMYQNLTIDTFGGMCGAAVVSESVHSVILGIHLGGTAGTPVGCYGSVTQQQLHTAFTALRKMEGVVLTGSAGVFETKVLGVQLLTGAALHNKSPLKFLPADSQIEYFGTCPGRTVTKSSVCVTPISEHVMEVCNVPNVYHGPKLNPDWFGWQGCLANMANPALPYPPDLLAVAIKDYKEPLIKICADKKWSNARPLTDQENLNGIRGKKFVDAINLNTSVGFPLTGPKRDHVIELEPTEEWPSNRILEEELMVEIRRIENLYKKGERGYTIAKACKKDEILSKEKCRIFFGNPLSLTFLIRKYFLPILRILQMNPLTAECAVGINSHGPEWEQFYKYVTKYGLKRLLGGDYKKYDQKLTAQLLLASLRILIDCARVCNYKQEDLDVMEAMCGDIVYAYIAFNGDLVGLTEGSHISGNSLTVILNGICGSLNLRCAFYTIFPTDHFESREVFRECVALGTYGDDNIGSVKEGFESFNIKSVAEFLAKYGQTYTMPDKDSQMSAFLKEDQFEFLKRTSVYHERLGVHVGALCDKSIYKSLHCYMREKGCVNTPEYACAINIDGALREWFNHGPEKFERQRDLMVEVAKRANISHLCTTLNKNYVERVAEWHDTYKH